MRRIRLWGSMTGLLLLVLGIVPGSLMALCAKAVVQMLAT